MHVAHDLRHVLVVGVGQVGLVRLRGGGRSGGPSRGRSTPRRRSSARPRGTARCRASRRSSAAVMFTAAGELPSGSPRGRRSSQVPTAAPMPGGGEPEGRRSRFGPAGGGKATRGEGGRAALLRRLDVLPQAGAAVQRVAGRPGRVLRPQDAGDPGRPVRRDHRRDAVRVPGLEHQAAGQVPRPAVRHRGRGVRPRRDDRDHDRPAAGEGAGGHGRGGGQVRPGRRRGDRRRGHPARDRRRRGCPPGRQQRQPLAGQLHHRQRQPAGRLHVQRERRDAGPPPGRPDLPHDRGQGRAGHALVPARPRHDAPEPVDRGRRRSCARRATRTCRCRATSRCPTSTATSRTPT